MIERPYSGIDDKMGFNFAPGNVRREGVGGQPEFSPMLHECFHRDFGGHQRLRPGARQPAVQRDDVEGLQAHSALQGESLDDVEAVELGPSL